MRATCEGISPRLYIFGAERIRGRVARHESSIRGSRQDDAHRSRQSLKHLDVFEREALLGHVPRQCVSKSIVADCAQE